jgi:glutaminase
MVEKMVEKNEKNDLTSLASSIQSVASGFRSYLIDLHEKYKTVQEGTVANYIPELALANPDWFGICVATTDGQVFEVGDCDKLFTIQSISKAFVYGMALEDYGRDYVWTKVSVEPTGEAFNSILLDEETNRPYNPMVNAGAIATADLIKGKGSTERLKRMLDMFRRYTGRELDINLPVFLSEKATGNRNRAIAYLMLNFGMIGEKIDETLDLYFQQCSIMVNARDLAMMGATLANGGVNPITGERAIDEHYVQDVLSVMLTCGMYDSSGEWVYRVGIPAKSGVGGGITAAVPGKLGIGTFSPRLDAKGNSVRGIKVCKEISRDFGLHLFNVAKSEHDLKAWIEGDELVDNW